MYNVEIDLPIMLTFLWRTVEDLLFHRPALAATGRLFIHPDHPMRRNDQFQATDDAEVRRSPGVVRTSPLPAGAAFPRRKNGNGGASAWLRKRSCMHQRWTVREGSVRMGRHHLKRQGFPLAGVLNSENG
jgi:hypothetical protein